MNIVHLILTIISGGLWLPVWVICLLIGMSKNSKKSANSQEELIKELKRQNALLAAKQ